MKRYPFLDWLRGLAVLLMIPCHTFNSYTRLDLRESGPYVLSQFIGGMAAPLFLFMAGMTMGFQIESPGRRWIDAFRRGAFVLGIAFLFRISNYGFSLPNADWHEITKVDILNCMGVAIMFFSPVARIEPCLRTRFALAGGLAIAAAAPLIANLDWTRAPLLLHDYLAPSPGTGRFAFFPYAAYVGFGLASGITVKRSTEPRFDRLMQWLVLVGFSLIGGGRYFASLPYSIYTKSDFWTDSPALVLIRFGICLVLMAGAYLWTEYCAGAGWSWMQALGRNSLMVYWVHVVLVYGDTTRKIQRGLSIPQTALATFVVIVLMAGLSAAWLAWKRRRRRPPSSAGTPAADSSPATSSRSA